MTIFDLYTTGVWHDGIRITTFFVDVIASNFKISYNDNKFLLTLCPFWKIFSTLFLTMSDSVYKFLFPPTSYISVAITKNAN